VFRWRRENHNDKELKTPGDGARELWKNAGRGSRACRASEGVGEERKSMISRKGDVKGSPTKSMVHCHGSCGGSRKSVPVSK